MGLTTLVVLLAVCLGDGGAPKFSKSARERDTVQLLKRGAVIKPLKISSKDWVIEVYLTVKSRSPAKSSW